MRTKLRRLPRPLKIGSLFAVGIFLVAMFQNFQPIPLGRFRPELSPAGARAISPTDGTADIRHLAPYRPEMPPEPTIIAQPQSGHDIMSIGQDWLQRQSHLITGGADERILANVNKKVNRMLKFEPLEDSPAVTGDEEGSGDAGAPAEGGGRQPASADGNDDSLGMRPTSMNLVAINQVQIGWKNKTKLNCAIDGDGMRLNVSRPLSPNFDVRLQHESARSKSTVQLNYAW